MEIGLINSLYIKRFSSFGAYLVDEHQNEVLLPKKFLSPHLKIGDLIKVFIHTDSEDRIVATTQTPLAQCNQIAILKIKSIDKLGCFLDLGIDKDIFMPTKNPSLFVINQKVCVFITLDKQKRLIAKLGVKNFLKPFYNFRKKYLKLPAFGFEKTPLGIGCVVDNQYYGILYQQELKAPVQMLEPIDVLIKKVRKDGKLDLKLDYLDSTKHLISVLKKNKVLNFNYDSSPQDIQETFKMSKKLFKKTISDLISKKQAEIRENKIFYLA
ncbi:MULTISPECIES: S1-like domain-containing RNA-binding protein [unclassified Helicobacter]|uniref:S1-like domain-containing RNA-binding protein n=1 Tax=unclassified Helicobacter TaxID=2593540 RepID=UPI000CF0949B|nr:MULTISPECIES: S1-like domain-containing RNA-binding protein [unclassified Helicobacter]